MEHRLGLAPRTQISVSKSPFPSAGTAVIQSIESESYIPSAGSAVIQSIDSESHIHQFNSDGNDRSMIKLCLRARVATMKVSAAKHTVDR